MSANICIHHILHQWKHNTVKKKKSSFHLPCLTFCANVILCSRNHQSSHLLLCFEHHLIVLCDLVKHVRWKQPWQITSAAGVFVCLLEYPRSKRSKGTSVERPWVMSPSNNSMCRLCFNERVLWWSEAYQPVTPLCFPQGPVLLHSVR